MGVYSNRSQPSKSTEAMGEYTEKKLENVTVQKIIS